MEREMSAPSPSKGKVFKRPHTPLWFLSRRVYTLFMLRELSAVFIMIEAVLHVWLLFSLGQGREAYASTLGFLTSPPMAVFHVVALAFVLYHSYTFFQMNGRIMTRFQGFHLPEAGIVAGGWIGLVVMSAGLGWLLAG
jgi:fumarate reductase subunit C